MAPSRKRLAVVAASSALAAGALFLMFRKPAPIPSPVIISFVGYTNGSSRPFALLSISNQAPYSVGWRDFWSEIEGDPEHHAPVVNFNLPRLPHEPLLKGKQSTLVAIGSPLDSPLAGRWRFTMICSPYTERDRWWHFSLRHPSARKMGRAVGFDYNGPLGPSNRVTVCSVWLTN